MTCDKVVDNTYHSKDLNTASHHIYVLYFLCKIIATRTPWAPTVNALYFLTSANVHDKTMFQLDKAGVSQKGCNAGSLFYRLMKDAEEHACGIQHNM